MTKSKTLFPFVKEVLQLADNFKLSDLLPNIPNSEPSKMVLLFLTQKSIKSSKAIMTLDKRGYAEDIYSILRSILENVINVKFIYNQADPEHWAKRYIEYQIVLSKQYADVYLKHGNNTEMLPSIQKKNAALENEISTLKNKYRTAIPSDFDKFQGKGKEIWDELIKAEILDSIGCINNIGNVNNISIAGVNNKELKGHLNKLLNSFGGYPLTWSGRTIRHMSCNCGMEYYYEVLYKLWSDFAHGNVQSSNSYMELINNELVFINRKTHANDAEYFVIFVFIHILLTIVNDKLSLGYKSRLEKMKLDYTKVADE